MHLSRNLFIALLLCFSALIAAAQGPQVKKTTAPRTSAVSGKEMYEAYCASCHGKQGKGDGPAAPAMKVPPTDLTQLAKANAGTFPVGRVQQAIRGDVAVAAHGSKDMPVWGPILWSVSSHDESQVNLRIANLSRYIESLQVK